MAPQRSGVDRKLFRLIPTQEHASVVRAIVCLAKAFDHCGASLGASTTGSAEAVERNH
jgi:hypothetical protein